MTVALPAWCRKNFVEHQTRGPPCYTLSSYYLVIIYVCSLRESIVVYSNGLCNDGHLGCLNGTQKSQLSVCKPFNMFYDKKKMFCIIYISI